MPTKIRAGVGVSLSLFVSFLKRVMSDELVFPSELAAEKAHKPPTYTHTHLIIPGVLCYRSGVPLRR